MEEVSVKNQGINVGNFLWLEGISPDGKDRGQSFKSTYDPEKLRGTIDMDDIVIIKEHAKIEMESSYVQVESVPAEGKSGADVKKFNIKIASLTGRVLVNIKDFCVRAAEYRREGARAGRG